MELRGMRRIQLSDEPSGHLHHHPRLLGGEVLLPSSGCRTSEEKHRWENIPDGDKGSGKFHRKAQPGSWREDLLKEQIRIVEDITKPLISALY